MLVTAKELTGKCPEHAVTIKQDIVHVVGSGSSRSSVSIDEE